MPREATTISLDDPAANGAEETSLWQEILNSASRHGERLPAKHVLVLGERNTGKSTLIEHLFANSPSSLYSFTSDPSSSTSHYAQGSQAKSRHVSSFLRLTSAGRDARAGAGVQGGRKVGVGGGAVVGGKGKSASAHGGRQGHVNGNQRRTGKDGDGEEDDDDDEGEDVLLDDRLKRTEGIVVDYEWVDVNDGDIGQSLAIFTIQIASDPRAVGLEVDETVTRS